MNRARTPTAEAYIHRGFESRQATALVAEWAKAEPGLPDRLVTKHRFWYLYEPDTLAEIARIGLTSWRQARMREEPGARDAELRFDRVLAQACRLLTQ
jgi:hypothetical protein